MAQKSNVGQVRLNNVRLSFAQIFEPKAVANAGEGANKPRYSCSFLLDKNTKEGAANRELVRTAINAVAREKWGKDIPKLKAEKLCLRDGDQEDWDGYAGNWYVTAASPETRRPVIVDRNRAPLVAKDGRPYSGCYVSAIVRVWAQDNNFGKRINASLEAIQFVRDGDAFGAPQIDPNAVFDDVSGDEGDQGMFTEAPDDDADDLV